MRVDFRKNTWFLALTGLLFIVWALSGCGSDKEVEHLSCTLNDQLLVEAKEALRNEEPAFMPVFEGLVAKAEEYFDMPLYAVVNKEKTAPSGDKQDYVTLSPYWWPNPETDDGLPYIQRDGERNPEVYDYPERENANRLSSAVEALGVLYFLTEDEKYARRAAEFLREWFINPDTRMNPNMVYAQIRPGIDRIRGTGIIDARRFIGAFNGASLIRNSEHWSGDDAQSLKDWAAAFAYWLENSPQGRMEKMSTNNHGVWYDVIVLNMHFYAGNDARVVEIFEEQTTSRVFVQQREDGSFPRELARTISLHYSTFVVEGFMVAAEIGKKVNYDLWSAVSEDGQSMRQAVDFLFPYYTKSEVWPHQQISPYDYNEGALLLYRAGLALADSTYINAAKSIGYDSDNAVASLMYYRINQ